MCGRFTNRYTWAELVRLYWLTGSSPASNFEPQYNIAPTENSFVVRVKDGERELASLRWGLVPFWAQNLKIGSKMINAQSETCATKPAFRDGFKSRRCLVVADGFYEWPTRTTPRLITLKNNEPFSFAGLWASWRPKDGERVETFTILTCQPNELSGLRFNFERAALLSSAALRIRRAKLNLLWLAIWQILGKYMCLGMRLQRHACAS